MTTAASAWGFTGTNDRDRDWVRLSVCPGNWDMFDVIGQELSAENQAALALCDTCPVRAECRDDYLAADRTPLGLVAGGWWWDYNGRAHPHPEDWRLAGLAQPPRRLTARVYTARRAITAARAVATEGLTHDAASRRVNASPAAVDAAVVILRHAPDLLTAVWEGDQTLTDAHTEATRRRQEAPPTPSEGSTTLVHTGQ